MWWNFAGPDNTLATVKEAAAYAEQHPDIKHMVVASNSGDTVLALLEQHPQVQISCVTHQIGFAGNGVDEMGEDRRKQLMDRGIRIFTGTHLLGGVNRSLRKKFSGVYPSEIIASTLRMFGEGTKVAVEIAVMALDAGCIPYGEDIISLAGTARGADTALLLRPAHADDFLNTEIKKFICKPGSRKVKQV